MAYDGIAAAAVVKELNDRLLMGSITKVAQPEKDELLLTLKCNRKQLRLSISANPQTPVACIREDNMLSPVSAPNFCMSLRKHIGGGRVVRIFQPSTDLTDSEGGLERIIVFAIEHLDEMGDLSEKYLVAELMGKYSNIILLNRDFTIIDSIKHISHMTSSVREVLPGRKYFIPDNAGKLNPRKLWRDEEEFKACIMGGAAGLSIYKKIYMSITGLSPTVSGEILFRAGVDPDRSINDITADECRSIFEAFSEIMSDVDSGRFEPNIIYDGDGVSEFSAIRLKSLEGGGLKAVFYDSVSEAVIDFYSGRARTNRIRAKSEDVRGVLKILTERAAKKLDLLEKQYKDTEGREKFRIYGELLNTYGYSLKGGEDSLTCENYYKGGELIRIPLDKDLTARENANRFFDKYNKLKRTREAVSVQLKECRDTLYHLGSISDSLELCETEADIDEIRREMAESGYIKSHPGGRKRREEKKSRPLHFVSSDGIDIYVGRNNFQNEELDFKVADNNDWWFHVKNAPGSHVIAKTGNIELPDNTCLEAAALAAYYSVPGKTAAKGDKIEVDYVKKKELKRVPKAAPGFVIYHTNYSIMIEPKAEL